MKIENIFFPTVCIDNFFNNPDKIRDMALSSPYFKCEEKGNGTWPGYRTIGLHRLNPDFFDAFCEKLMGVYFGPIKTVECKIEAHFQKINSNFFNGINSGWVHRDHGNLFAGIIYLNKDIDPNNGTSIYIPKLKDAKEINLEYKKEMYSDFKKEKTTLYDQKRRENNEQFEKTITFNNVYNRMIIYEGNHFHAENSFEMPEHEDRLTLVFFVRELKNTYSHIELSRQIDL